NASGARTAEEVRSLKHFLPGAAHLSCVSLFDDGSHPRRIRCVSRQRRTTEAGNSLDLDTHRNVDGRESRARRLLLGWSVAPHRSIRPSGRECDQEWRDYFLGSGTWTGIDAAYSAAALPEWPDRGDVTRSL